MVELQVVYAARLEALPDTLRGIPITPSSMLISTR
jgi:hypothetical protein